MVCVLRNVLNGGMKPHRAVPAVELEILVIPFWMSTTGGTFWLCTSIVKLTEVKAIISALERVLPGLQKL